MILCVEIMELILNIPHTIFLDRDMSLWPICHMNIILCPDPHMPLQDLRHSLILVHAQKMGQGFSSNSRW